MLFKRSFSSLFLKDEYINYVNCHFQQKKYGEVKIYSYKALKTDTLNKATYELLPKIKYDSIVEFECILFLKKQVDENLYT